MFRKGFSLSVNQQGAVKYLEMDNLLILPPPLPSWSTVLPSDRPYITAVNLLLIYLHRIDPLQLTSSIRVYGKGHQHGSYLAFLGDSNFYGDLGKHNHAPTMLLVCVESDEM